MKAEQARYILNQPKVCPMNIHDLIVRFSRLIHGNPPMLVIVRLFLGIACLLLVIFGNNVGVRILFILLSIGGYLILEQSPSSLPDSSRSSESEERFKKISDLMPVFIAYIDSEQCYRFCNAQYLAEFDLTMSELLSCNMKDVFGEQAYASIQPYVLQVLSGQEVVFERKEPERSDEHFSSYHYVPDKDQSGKVRGFYSIISDISKQKLSEVKLENSEKLLRGLTDHLPVLLSYIDRDENFQFNNQPHEKWLGKPLADITHHSIREACGDDVYFKYKRYLDQALAGERIDFAFATDRNGAKRYFNAAFNPQFDENGGVAGVCSMINDITDMKKVELQLIKLARVDSLTGLPNRIQFDDNLRSAILRSRRSGLSMALMYLDIDHFRTINDSYGHQAGDEALCEFSKRILSSLRKTDNVARLSGDEFVVIIEEMKTENEAEIVARKIIQAMEPDFVYVDQHYKVTTSIGIAVLQENDLEPHSLLRRADQDLYLARSSGRNYNLVVNDKN